MKDRQPQKTRITKAATRGGKEQLPAWPMTKNYGDCSHSTTETLKEVAQEVQKNEGAGGKSEKAKQVFAMLWLQETCQRSNNSVRRDRVFARYTERCGNERVPTLNPASFGKLVRIIFPNVQTIGCARRVQVPLCRPLADT